MRKLLLTPAGFKAERLFVCGGSLPNLQNNPGYINCKINFNFKAELYGKVKDETVALNNNQALRICRSSAEVME